MQLLRDKNVVFAGYQLPHPLEHKTLVRVQTLDGGPAQVVKCVQAALGDLSNEFDVIERSLDEQIRAKKAEAGV